MTPITDKIKALPDGDEPEHVNDLNATRIGLEHIHRPITACFDCGAKLDETALESRITALVSELETKTRALERFAEQDCCRDAYPQQYADGNCQHYIAQAALKGEG